MSTTRALRAGIYARVSTSAKGQSVDNQLLQLREYVERRGWTIAAEYVDEGESGRKRSRPSLDRMMADAKRRKLDVVCAWSFDRLGRSLYNLVDLGKTLHELDVQMLTLRENVDTTTTAGRFFFHLCASFAEFEADLMRDRIEAGIARARAKGVTLGRPRKYELPVERILALRAENRSINSICKELALPTTSVRRLLATHVHGNT
jgi:DNA invertase Pin-like site-specific DNA recombinase